MNEWMMPLVVLASGAIAAEAIACEKDRAGVSVQSDSGRPIDACSDLKIRFDDRETRRKERTIPLVLPAGGRPYRVRVEDHGGIRLQALRGRAPSILICEAAGVLDGQSAGAIFDQTKIDVDEAQLTVSGPKERDWTAEIVIFAPPDASFELAAENGELSIIGVSGRFDARTTNGPVSVIDAGGSIEARTKNGPIEFRGHSGKVSLEAKNGSVAVELTAPTWSGEGLIATTRNGPLFLDVPGQLQTGVLIEGGDRAPFSCDLAECDQRRSREGVLELGPGTTRVKLATRNGPIEISSRSGR